jgi:hypothetical protein
MMPFWHGWAENPLTTNSCSIAPLWHGLSLDAERNSLLTGESVDSEAILRGSWSDMQPRKIALERVKNPVEFARAVS